MSTSSDFRDVARNAENIVEAIGESGQTYVFFFFKDQSVCSAQRSRMDAAGAAATWDFGVTIRDALDDCGVADFEGTTYQKGQEFLRRLHLRD